MNMKKLRFLFILIIGVAFLNSIFAATVIEKYYIKGDLVLSDSIITSCSGGVNTFEPNGGTHYSDSTGESIAGFSIDSEKIDNRWFFAESGDSEPFVYPCTLEIYSPNDNNRKIYEYSGLSAVAIKELLNQGIMVGPIHKEVNTDSYEFLIKIVKNSPTPQTLVQTKIKVPNKNSNSNTIISDSVAIGSIFSRHLADHAISLPKLNILNSTNMGNKDNFVIGWDTSVNGMTWIPINGDSIANGSIGEQHLKESLLYTLNNKIDKQIHTVGANDVIRYIDGEIVEVADRDDKYLKFSIDGDTYLVPIFKLTSENPILNFVPTKVSATVGSTKIMYGSINDIPSSSLAISITNNNGYIQVTGPQTFVSGGETKVKLSIQCLAATLNTPLPRITITGNSINNNTFYSDSFDVNCTADPNGYISIVTSSGTIYTDNRTIWANGANIYSNTVEWVITPYSVQIHEIGYQDGYYKANVDCGVYSGPVTVTVSANKLYDNTPVSDTQAFTCSINSTPPSGGCFLEGTKVYTPNGWRNIEDIKRNDVVYSLEDNKLVETKVNGLLVHGMERTMDPSVKLELSNGKTLFVTVNHAMYSPKDKDYKQLKYFNIGDNLLYYNEVTKDFEYITISNITKLPDFDIVYNLSLETPNNYLAEGIVVHNDQKHGDGYGIENPSGTDGGVQH